MVIQRAGFHCNSALGPRRPAMVKRFGRVTESFIHGSACRPYAWWQTERFAYAVGEPPVSGHARRREYETNNNNNRVH